MLEVDEAAVAHTAVQGRDCRRLRLAEEGVPLPGNHRPQKGSQSIWSLEMFDLK